MGYPFTDIDPDALRTRLRRHQGSVQDLPGMADPSTSGPGSSTTIADALDLDADECRSLVFVHDRQACRTVREGGADASTFDDRAAVVLVRR